MKKPLWAAAAGLHLTLILAICGRDFCHVVGSGGTLFPVSSVAPAQGAEGVLGVILLDSTPKRNLLRQTLYGYLNDAGIEAGYGFFGPNIPRAYRLDFELTYEDGRVTVEQMGAKSGEAALRLDSLLDVIGRPDDPVVREALIQLLAKRVWLEHEGLTRLRAHFQIVDSPSLLEYARGKRQSTEVLYSYEMTASPAGVTP